MGTMEQFTDDLSYDVICLRQCYLHDSLLERGQNLFDPVFNVCFHRNLGFNESFCKRMLSFAFALMNPGGENTD